MSKVTTRDLLHEWDILLKNVDVNAWKLPQSIIGLINSFTRTLNEYVVTPSEEGGRHQVEWKDLSAHAKLSTLMEKLLPIEDSIKEVQLTLNLQTTEKENV